MMLRLLALATACAASEAGPWMEPIGDWEIRSGETGADRFDLADFEKVNDPVTTAQANLLIPVGGRGLIWFAYAPFEAKDFGRFDRGTQFGDAVHGRVAGVSGPDRLDGGRLRQQLHLAPLDGGEFRPELRGVRLVFKMEMFQRTGSFKIRGGLTLLANMPSDDRSRGLVTATRG